MRIGKSSSTAGFTLVELMLVVAIIGVLASIALPKFADLVTKAREAVTKGRLGALRSTIAIYTSDNEGIYPIDPAVNLTAGKKYINEIPEADLPPYHRGRSIMLNNVFIKECDPSLDYYWIYNTPSLSFVWAPDPHVGEFNVACMHSDSRGTTWSSY